VFSILIHDLTNILKLTYVLIYVCVTYASIAVFMQHRLPMAANTMAVIIIPVI